MRIVSRLSTLAVVLAAFTACTSDPVTPPVQTPTISIAATTAAATAARGTTATYPLTITRGGGFTGAVTLAAEGVPTGVTATFTPASVATGATTASLALAVGATAVTGSNTITVRASGTGVTSQTATVTLTVPAPPPTPAITLVAGATTATVVQGAATTIPITITRIGDFTSAVDVTVEGLPTGVTAGSLSLAAGVTTGTLTLTATAAAAATTTPASIIIRASGTGVTSQTATVALTVASAATPGFTLMATPAALTATAGQGGTSTLTLARTGGFTGAVDLTVTGAPTGLTATVAPNSLTGATLTSTLTVATTAATAPGTYTLTITGTSAGTSRTATVMFTVTAAAGITVALAPATLSIAQGGSATSNITLARVGGLTGDIALTATGLPTGATVTFAPTTATGTATASVATVAAGAATPAGLYSVVITGTGAGSVAGAATLALTVTAATVGNYTLAAAPATVSIAQGATGTSTITLTRTGGFAGAVGLAVSGLPTGITSTFNPASVTTNSSTLSLAVAGSVAAGTYNGTITGTATGLANVTTPITVTVTTAGGGGGLVGFRFCAQDFLPTFFAFRNGSTGAWVAVTATANSTFSFTLTQSVGQVAYGVANGNGGVNMTVLYYAAAEFPGIANQQCITNPATKAVTGTVAGLATGQSATVSLGGGTASVNANGAFTIMGATAGVTDVVATRSTINLMTFLPTVDKVIIRRGINPAPGGSIGAVLDFGAAEAVAPTSAAYTINNTNSEQIIGINSFSSAGGGTASFLNFSATTSPITLFGVPSSLTQAGDFHSATVFASATVGDLTTTRAFFQYNRDVAARTLTLGAAVTAPTFTTTATSPYARIRAQGPWQADYGDAVSASYSQGSLRSWGITASRGYFGAGSAQYDVELPDLSGVTGFNNSWGLVVGTSTQYSISTYGGFAGLTAITEGASFRFASRSGTLTP